MKQIIEIKKEVNYLGEVMKSLPENCLFNKGSVGGGGTTIALTEARNTIVTVPYVEMIKNKEVQVAENTNGIYPYGVLGVYNGVDEYDIMDFIDDTEGFVKILVTYDSLPKVMSVINPSEYHLLIDESHLLMQQYIFRNEAVLNVLEAYKQFQSFTFMTATPIKQEYKLSELLGLPEVECVWEEENTVKFIPTKCKSIKGTSRRIVRNHLKGLFAPEGSNLHIFVNSVTFIKELIEACQLDETNTRVIYGKSNKTKLKIKNGSTTDPVKSINLYTSTVFEGADLYDENGVVIVISDTSKKTTLLDISTQLEQIAGRIRNTKYSSKIYHFFNTNKYLDNDHITAEEFKAIVREGIRQEEKFLALNGCDSVMVKKLIGGMEYAVINPVTGCAEIDSNRLNWEMRNFEIIRGVYRTQVNVIRAYKQNGLEAALGSSRDDEYIKVPTQLGKITIEEYLEEYELITLPLKKRIFFAELMEGEYKWLPEAIEVLGVDKIRELNYNKANIAYAVEAKNSKDTREANLSKVFRLLDKSSKISTGKFISSADAKKLIQKAYDALGIQGKAKGTDLGKYYTVETTSCRVNGKVKQGFVVIKSNNRVKVK